MISFLVILPGSLIDIRKGMHGKRIWPDDPYEATHIAVTFHSLGTFPSAASVVLLQSPNIEVHVF